MSNSSRLSEKEFETSKSKDSNFAVFSEEDASSTTEKGLFSSGFLQMNKEFKMQRHLKSRHIQMIAIGGSIGTGLFVTISNGLINGGPGSLFIATTFWTLIILMLTTAIGEMVCYLPVASPFIEMAGRCVDEAFEVCAGYNFFLMEACYIPFEITACNTMIHYWRSDYSPAITFVVQTLLYVLFNVFTVKWFGESEFWMSITKLILCIGLLFFTFITMVGGNPQHDAFGFRYWNDPGAFATYYRDGPLGRFQGFVSALTTACFFVVGPEYLSMVAAEARNPKKTMSGAFRTVIYRLALFYIGGALSVGILVAYNDPTLVAHTGQEDASASPYVVAMNNMGISGLPHVINVTIIMSAASAGNSYFYAASRQLYALAKRGYAPSCFQMVTKKGIPITCMAVTTCFALLSLLQLGNDSAVVLEWIVNLVTGAQMLNYAFMCVTYYCFYRAVNAQGLDRMDRKMFIYRSWFQPYSIIIAGAFIWTMVFILGYSVFLPGNWSIETFLFSYVMIFVNLAIFLFWKILKRTSFRKPAEVDLVTGMEEIDEHIYEYYANLEANNQRDDTLFRRIMAWVF
ncbi:High affinity polyamine permease [Komagataella phaffii CBS 7435]|uniref:High affinity polyamine permease n=2 Tax=Komagataella phaffii TaxID=460519 RepID=C4R5R3_KOMPG|nr:High affinity polyamine permease [Komagataella phaffii GS115]AOA64138.1 GQ67_03957T0 [Komagataella phaffii]CAH2449292.1 High affinity polyamine permease [Komagataella phaffii CBS 7435]AOA68251.1 GQ68_03931T0 [Komagataella phaffii GS115]CAY70899.1 High affinity polyamine permease [Komagataella phaffii GS115]CCA39305.1 High affinity polyamine permease [Komagataella phaffii CBS 7435]